MKDKKDPGLTIRQKTVFPCMRRDVAERLILALSLAGYYVRSSHDSDQYRIEIWTDRTLTP